MKNKSMSMSAFLNLPMSVLNGCWDCGIDKFAVGDKAIIFSCFKIIKLIFCVCSLLSIM